MSIFAAVVLTLAAGITEFIPVSGTGHLNILAKLLGVQAAGAEFRAYRGAVLLGCALALLLFYRFQVLDVLREALVLLGILRPARRSRALPFGRRLGLLLVLSLLPMVLSLLLGKLRAEAEVGAHSLALVSLFLALSGVALFFAGRAAAEKRDIHQLTLNDSLLAGGIQAVSVLPGLSRTGCVMSLLLAQGLEGPAALEFSGLMGILPLLIAGLWELIGAGAEAISAPMLILGCALSALTGFFTLRYLTELLTRRRPTLFAYWCWGASILALILFLISA